MHCSAFAMRTRKYVRLSPKKIVAIEFSLVLGINGYIINPVFG